LRVFQTICLIFITLITISCGNTINDFFDTDQTKRSFLVNSPSFNLDVRYEQNAQPFFGTLDNGRDIWSILRVNLRAILPRSINQINIQSRLSQMTPIRSFGVSAWTKDRLRGMAVDSSFGISGLTNNTITAIFLRGFYVENPKALGIHFKRTSVIFIFKDVVEGLRANSQPLSALQLAAAEQSTLVHEIGHAIGLVNDTVAMTWGLHEDKSNPNHCTNPNCIMFKQNNGSEARQRIMGARDESGLILFGHECLTDLFNHYNEVQFN